VYVNAQCVMFVFVFIVTHTRPPHTHSHTHTGEAKKAYNLITCSSDGKVLMWTLDNQLKAPKYGAVLVPTRKYYGQGCVECSL
jgi:hypothetical protein